MIYVYLPAIYYHLNLDVTKGSLLAVGFSTVPAVFLVYEYFSFSLTSTLWEPKLGSHSATPPSIVNKSRLNPSFQTFSEFSSQWTLQKYCFGFLKFKVFRFSLFFFFFVFVNMGPYGSQNFKMLLLPQISFESFQPFTEFSSQWSSQKYCTVLDFWNFGFPIFNEFLNFNFVPYGETKNLNYLENEPS